MDCGAVIRASSPAPTSAQPGRPIPVSGHQPRAAEMVMRLGRRLEAQPRAGIARANPVEGLRVGRDRCRGRGPPAGSHPAGAAPSTKARTRAAQTTIYGHCPCTSPHRSPAHRAEFAPAHARRRSGRDSGRARKRGDLLDRKYCRRRRSNVIDNEQPDLRSELPSDAFDNLLIALENRRQCGKPLPLHRDVPRPEPSPSARRHRRGRSSGFRRRVRDSGNKGQH